MASDGMETRPYKGHVLVVPAPTQGHINPMLQFTKRLASKGLRATLAITRFIWNSRRPRPSASVHLDIISDGYDEGGYTQAVDIRYYVSRFKAIGSETLADLIIKYNHSDHPVDCVIYDSFCPWGLDVAKKFGLLAAAFFTQNCAVNYIYYLVHHGIMKLPLLDFPISIPGLPTLELSDFPSFIYDEESYHGYLEVLVGQFINADKADWILVNTFSKLETEAVGAMSKLFPLLTIGPTIPSVYMDKRVEDDDDYGLHLFDLDSSDLDTWLGAHQPKSVVYVSFGSLSAVGEEQMEELAWGLHGSGHPFLWVVRASENTKISKKCKEAIAAEQALIVSWCCQLDVLSSGRIGCFFSHCGWNSTIEAISMGVPMVAMPQWTDQTTDAKLVQDFWEVGVRIRAGEDGLVRRDEIERSIREVMETERGRTMTENATKWMELAVEAVSEDGTTDRNIKDFISGIVSKKGS
ncbi:hypothetical protein SAY86_025939 [Trapa natans]|uniref:Glycosyltransferase n=1 Tax=Trapa natans TaxID=22666 RepID=A0AAN7KH25_TRANT|nr:hypothetical protein SAY86_025939 [Trapa natans]